MGLMGLISLTRLMLGFINSLTFGSFTFSTALFFLGGVAGEADAEFFEDFVVDFAEHDGGVYLTAVELGEALEGEAAVFVLPAEH